LDNKLEFLIYKTPEEDIMINAVLQDETLWLTQKGMAELFATSKQNISYHVNNCFNEGEVDNQNH
jgi:hypothetical protein